MTIRTKTLLDWETNPNAYSKTRKMYLERRRDIHCSRCPYHRGENACRHGSDHRSWKNYRRDQWK